MAHPAPGGSARLGKVHAYAIDNSSEHFPQGSLRIVNITGLETIGCINTNELNVPNGTASQAILSAHSETLDISITAKSNQHHHLLYKNTLRITSGSRGLLILRPPTRKGSLRIGGHLLLESANEFKAATPLQIPIERPKMHKGPGKVTR